MRPHKGSDATRPPLHRLHQQEVLAEQVKQLYLLAPIGILATALNSIIVFMVMREVMPLHEIGLWLAAVIVLAALRLGLVLCYHLAPQPDPVRWQRRFLVSLTAIGAAWGSIGMFPFTFSISHQVFVAFVLGGMTAGSAATFSKVRYGFAAFSVPNMLPLTLHFFLVADRFHVSMGIMTFLYLTFLGYISRHNYNVNRTSLLLRFENRDMIEDLKRAKESVEGLNAQLLGEVKAKRQAEAELRAHKEHLEGVVEERTADLMAANEKLKREIEERKQVEASLLESRERLVMAQRAGRVGVFDWHMKSGKLLWTAELEELFGLQPGTFGNEYQDWAHRVHPEDLSRLERDVVTWMAQRLSQVDYEYRFLRADGDVRWMSSKAQFTYAEDGTPLRMIGTNQDITEAKEAEQKLLVAKEAAEAGTLAKSEFLANMSHEMRTPLAGVLGMIKLVLDMKIGNEERQLLEMARRSAESLLRLIADLLDFSRLEAGKMRFERKPFSVETVLKEAAEVVALSARERGLAFSSTVEPGVPEQIVGDAGRVRQVLVNLLGNAVKFTERGSIEVTVRLQPDPEGGGARFILFSVRDTGVGIGDAHLEGIFGKFTQIDSSLTRRFGGAGLGLGLSRQIVEKMGGRIWAESTVGVGSTFHFIIPEASGGD